MDIHKISYGSGYDLNFKTYISNTKHCQFDKTFYSQKSQEGVETVETLSFNQIAKYRPNSAQVAIKKRSNYNFYDRSFIVWLLKSSY